MNSTTLSFWGRQALDALVYAVSLTVAVVVVSAVISFALGGAWLGVKFILFFVGIGAFGLATFKLRPTPPWKDNERLPATREEKTLFQSVMARVSPVDLDRLAPDEQLSDGTKLFVASLLMLAVSFLMESVLGVTR